MILFLLCPLLIAGIKSQTANVTVEERSRAEGNQTFGVSTDENVTSSLYGDEKSLIEAELENNNRTFISEDDERFQDPGTTSPRRHCDHALLVFASDIHCGTEFHNVMFTISSENWCHLEHISRPYSDLTRCLEKLSNSVDCFYPNQDTQDFFLSIHSQYFHNCSNEELVFEDAPHWLVMVLTLIPVSIIPVLVYLVVWKSKVQE
ncbi:receptor activity-modifying protein 3-like [Hippoglossus hippoglossus]|uniref:receptor activity-modifying protein 3-like n=1 Tax=Hippoglossus hippoglossus TaxID=8267 RepID=UPI00148B757A|nr:receptor activity-modifying protein 3-like [Hippoglossus hippoglossus]